MSFTEKMTMPDGSERAEYRGPMTGPISIGEHILGDQFARNPRNPDEIDIRTYVEAIPYIKSELLKQHSWLEKIPVNRDDLLGAGEEKDAFRREWINALAKKYGEWHTVKTDRLAPEIGNTKQALPTPSKRLLN